MAKLKGVRKLNKSIGMAFRGFGIDKMFLDTEYAYYFEGEKIAFKLTEGTPEDELFKEFVFERFGYEIKLPWLFSILHEIGHHKANDEIEGAIYDFCMSEKERIQEEMETAFSIEDAKILEWQYFNLPDEIMATQWAVNYARKHPRKIKKIWAECETAIHEFYKKNLD